MNDRKRVLQRRRHLMFRRKMINFDSWFDAMWCFLGRKRAAVSVRYTCRRCGTDSFDEYGTRRPRTIGLYAVIRGQCNVSLEKVRDEAYPLPKLPKKENENVQR